MRKRDLVLENERLKGELGFLRGQIDQLQKTMGGNLEVVERIVGQFTAPAVELAPPLDIPGFNPGELGLQEMEDWSDRHIGEPGPSMPLIHDADLLVLDEEEFFDE